MVRLRLRINWCEHIWLYSSLFMPVKSNTTCGLVNSNTNKTGLVVCYFNYI